METLLKAGTILHGRTGEDMDLFEKPIPVRRLTEQEFANAPNFIKSLHQSIDKIGMYSEVFITLETEDVRGGYYLCDIHEATKKEWQAMYDTWNEGWEIGEIIKER